MAFDAAVVGSGPNGLAAAIALAQTGRRVVVYEAAKTPGGGTRSEERTLPGFVHDVCSAVQPMALASPFFSRLGLQAEGLRFIHPEVPLAHPLEHEPAVMLYRSRAQTAAALGADAEAWSILFGPLEQDFDKLVAGALAPFRLPRHPLLLSRFGLQGFRSAHGLAQGWFTTERARALFAGCAAHSVLPLTQAPSAAIGLMLAAAGHAVGWPIVAGGSEGIWKALLAKLLSLGGEVVTERPIRALAEIESEGPILFDTSCRALSRIAGSALPARYHKKLLAFQHGPGSCKVDFALAGPIPWSDPDVARAATVHLGGSLLELSQSEQAPHENKIPERPYVLLCQQSLFDERAPPGQHTAWAYCHVPNGCSDDVSDRIIAQIERFAPGFQDLVLAQVTTTASGFERYNANLVGGDIGGGRTNFGQLFTRPAGLFSPYATPNPRLFLCSSSTPPGGGVHGMCGFWAAKAAAPEVQLPG